MSAMTAAVPIVSVYADESCLGNGREGDNPGGAAGLVEYHPPGGGVVRRDYWLSEPATTNNRMALRSAIEAFRLLSRKGERAQVHFTSDSRYLVDGITSWVRDWSRRGWRRKSGPIENLVLWQELLEAAGAHNHCWRWVRGHNGHPQNEWANELATRAAAELSASKGLVASRFDAWLATERARGRMSAVEDAVPSSAEFTAGFRLPGAATGRLL